jgi:hypothetical protein
MGLDGLIGDVLQSIVAPRVHSWGARTVPTPPPADKMTVCHMLRAMFPNKKR